MKYTIERVNPSSIAKVISVTAAFLLVLLFLIALVMRVSWSFGGGSGPGLNVSNFGLMTIVLPFIYMIGIYISSYIAALTFSVATRLVGGIQVELSDR